MVRLKGGRTKSDKMDVEAGRKYPSILMIPGGSRSGHSLLRTIHSVDCFYFRETSFFLLFYQDHSSLASEAHLSRHATRRRDSNQASGSRSFLEGAR